MDNKAKDTPALGVDAKSHANDAPWELPLEAVAKHEESDTDVACHKLLLHTFAMGDWTCSAVLWNGPKDAEVAMEAFCFRLALGPES